MARIVMMVLVFPSSSAEMLKPLLPMYTSTLLEFSHPSLWLHFCLDKKKARSKTKMRDNTILRRTFPNQLPPSLPMLPLILELRPRHNPKTALNPLRTPSTLRHPTSYTSIRMPRQHLVEVSGTRRL